jgi:uncharacterized ferredoxin-like protein
MLITEQESRRDAIRTVAQQMLTAARTAPKGRGRDTLMLAVAYDDTLAAIADTMEEIGKATNTSFFLRDALNVRQSQAMVLIGTVISPLGLSHCGFCGFETCERKNGNPAAPCAINTIDLGIAIGSAVKTAASHCVDSRVMFSAGKAALRLGLLGETVKIALGIPLSCSEKSPYFDR